MEQMRQVGERGRLINVLWKWNLARTLELGLRGLSVTTAVYGAGRTASVASTWMEDPSDKGGLLLKCQLCPSFPVQG